MVVGMVGSLSIGYMIGTIVMLTANLLGLVP